MDSKQKEILRLGREHLDACRRIKAEDCGEPLVALPRDDELWLVSIQPLSAVMVGGRAFLRQSVMSRFTAAAREVKKKFRGKYKLRIIDAFRPPPVQVLSHAVTRMYYRILLPELGSESDLEAFTNSFSASPEFGGHPCGAAVDVTLWDNGKNKRVDLGSRSLKAIFIDPFRRGKEDGEVPEIDPGLKRDFDQCFLDQGFVRTPCEWWHFSYGDFEWAQLSGRDATLYQPVPWRMAMFLGKYDY